MPKDRRTKRVAVNTSNQAEDAKRLKSDVHQGDEKATAAADEDVDATVTKTKISTESVLTTEADGQNIVETEAGPIEDTASNPPPPPPSPSDKSQTPPTETPSNFLYATSLPPDCNTMMLAMLFRQYPGYKDVRIPRAGLGFIEFEDEPHATVALGALNGFKLTANDTLVLKYGKA